MTPYRITLTFDELPRMQSDIMRPYARSAYRRRWKVLVRNAASGRCPLEPLEVSRLRCTRFSSVMPDYDGLVAGFKPLIDALQPSEKDGFPGIIENDRMDNLIGFNGPQQEYQWSKCKPRQGYVVMELEEVVG